MICGIELNDKERAVLAFAEVLTNANKQELKMTYSE
jgi:hypothetical protein